MAVDQFLVNRANDAVKAWNWTTGRTRADLAGLDGSAGYLSVSFSPFKLDSSSSAYSLRFIYPMLLITGIPNLLLNYRLDSIEKNYSNDVKHPFSELSKEANKKSSAVSGILGILTGSPFYDMGDSESYSDYMGIGFGLISASHYIMRADYIPPSKENAWTRAKDLTSKLGEKVKNSLPAPHPEPVPISTNYLEDRI